MMETTNTYGIFLRVASVKTMCGAISQKLSQNGQLGKMANLDTIYLDTVSKMRYQAYLDLDMRRGIFLNIYISS